MARRLRTFALEAWMRKAEGAPHFVGGSGMPQGDLAAVLGEARTWLDGAWNMPAQEAWEGLKAALARTYGGRPDQYLPTAGASEADAAVALALLGAGDRAVVERPAYFALLEPARALGARVARIPWTRRGRSPSAPFSFDVTKACGAVRAGTRLVSMARPNNPTGARVPDADLKAIAQRCGEVGARILVDEVFAEATPQGERPSARLDPNILSVNSLTKCLGFGALQVGWVHGEAETVERVRLAKWHLRPSAPTLNLVAAAAVLGHRERLLATMRQRRARNIGLVRSFAESTGLAWSGEGHGTTCVLRLPGRNDLDFARRLLRHGVGVAPGSLVEMPGWIRIGYLAAPESLSRGLETIGGLLGGRLSTAVSSASG